MLFKLQLTLPTFYHFFCSTSTDASCLKCRWGAGCLLGMVPLWFIDTRNRELRASKIHMIYTTSTPVSNIAPTIESQHVVLHPTAPSGAGCTTRLGSRMKQLTPIVFMLLIFQELFIAVDKEDNSTITLDSVRFIGCVIGWSIASPHIAPTPTKRFPPNRTSTGAGHSVGVGHRQPRGGRAHIII